MSALSLVGGGCQSGRSGRGKRLPSVFLAEACSAKLSVYVCVCTPLREREGDRDKTHTGPAAASAAARRQKERGKEPGRMNTFPGLYSGAQPDFSACV